jgi:hypothetical protein
MASRFTELAIDCADPHALARFWCAVLDYQVRDEDDGIVTIGSPLVPEGRSHPRPVPPTLTFARVPDEAYKQNPAFREWLTTREISFVGRVWTRRS